MSPYRSILFPVLLVFGILAGRPGLEAASLSPALGLVLKRPESFVGYTLFAPSASTRTYLVDIDGQLVNLWKSEAVPGLSAYLLEDGRLLRTSRYGFAFGAGGAGGRIEEYGWDGTLLWRFDYSNAQRRQHHDTIKLPGGNVLILAWETRTQAEAILAGRNPATVSAGGLWPTHLVEVQPNGPSGGVVVWEWHVWDHLVQEFDPTKANYGAVADHPELVDINYSGSRSSDMLHCNSISYRPDLDQILISVHRFNEIWVIDHGTTTAEAAGHVGGRQGKGGDLLYRWGNPRAYDRGTLAEQRLWAQHNASWIPTGMPGQGNVLVFNNGAGRPGGSASSVVEIEVPVDKEGDYLLAAGEAYGPAEAALVYGGTPPESFYASFISGAQRLANGNTLICDGPAGRFFEVTAEMATVWDYISPVNHLGPMTEGSSPFRTDVFRAYRYAPDFPGLAGQNLTPQGPVELPLEYVFELRELERTEAGTVLRWGSLPDRRYAVEYTEALGNGWVEVGMALALGTSTTFTDESMDRSHASHGYYRVREEP